MARLVIAAGTVTLVLTRVERLEAFHGDVAAPVASVVTVRASDDLWSELRGIRAPGTGIPRVISVCTRRGPFGRDFAVVHGTGPGVVVEFADQEFQRWVVSAADPAAEVAALSAAAGLT